MTRALILALVLAACTPIPQAPPPTPTPIVQQLVRRADGSYVYLFYGQAIAEIAVSTPVQLRVKADTVDQEEQTKAYLTERGCLVVHDDWNLETGRPFSGDRILTLAEPCGALGAP